MKKIDEIDAAKKLLESNAQKRAEDCMDEIKEVLKKHDCLMGIVPKITINDQQPQIRIIANK